MPEWRVNQKKNTKIIWWKKNFVNFILIQNIKRYFIKLFKHFSPGLKQDTCKISYITLKKTGRQMQTENWMI